MLGAVILPLFLSVLRSIPVTIATNETKYLFGYPTCPCLDGDVIVKYPREWFDAEAGESINLKEIGYDRCLAHDLPKPQCQEVCPDDTQRFLPTPTYCDKSWCQLKYCYVNPDTCPAIDCFCRSLLFVCDLWRS